MAMQISAFGAVPFFLHDEPSTTARGAKCKSEKGNDPFMILKSEVEEIVKEAYVMAQTIWFSSVCVLGVGACCLLNRAMAGRS